jgi:hypothetical protein
VLASANIATPHRTQFFAILLPSGRLRRAFVLLRFRDEPARELAGELDAHQHIVHVRQQVRTFLAELAVCSGFNRALGSESG